MSSKDESFNSFYSEVKEIEKRDSVLTSAQQIDRLNRPGCSYFNLNPYDVLQVDPDTPLVDIKKKYRQLSLLVHPDKNPDDKERSQKAFEAISKAYKTLEDPETCKKSIEVYEEAKERVRDMMQEKKNRLKKSGLTTVIDEDNPIKFRHAVYVQTCKLFADLERLRVDDELKQSNERKRKAEQEVEEKELQEYNKIWKKNFEESRQDRVASWRDFKTKKSKSAKSLGGLKPPKTKMEQRQ